MTDEIIQTLRSINGNILSLHGDVKVALDRTAYHSDKIRAIEEVQVEQGKDIAKAKAQAAVVAAGGSGIFALLIEFGRQLFGGHH